MYVLLQNVTYVGFCVLKPIKLYLLSVSTVSLMIVIFGGTRRLFCLIMICCGQAKYVLRTAGRTILKPNWQNAMQIYLEDSSGSEQNPVAVFSQNADFSLRFQNKDMEFIEWLSNCQVLDQDFYSNGQS